MRVQSGVSFTQSLYNVYFGKSSTSINAKQSQEESINSDAAISSLNVVKAKLLSLADRSKKILERPDIETSQAVEIAEDPIGVPETETSTVSVSFSTENAPSKARKFDRQIRNSLQRAYKSENGKLLKDSSLSGDVKVNLTEGENSDSFSIRVDGSTTAKQFVDEFNSKAGGKAKAELKSVVVNGKNRQQISVEGATTTTTLFDDDGETSDDISKVKVTEADAAQFEQDVKKFVSVLNSLVKSVSKDNADGTLSNFQTDDNLVQSLKSLIQTLDSEDGSVKLSSIISSKKSGEYSVDSGSLRSAFINNTEGVIDVFRNLTDSLSGSKGIAKDYAGYGGNIDRASSIARVVGKEALQDERRSNTAQDDSQKISISQKLANLRV
jgi:hypothetical protein